MSSQSLLPGGPPRAACPCQTGRRVSFEEVRLESGHVRLLFVEACPHTTTRTPIAADPSQYQWSYKRFKRNETLPDPYRHPPRTD